MHRPKGIFVTDTFKYSVRLINLTAQHCIGSTRVTRCEGFYAGFWRKHRLSFFQALLPTLNHGGTAFGLDDSERGDPVNESHFFQFLKAFVAPQWPHPAT